MLNAPPDPVIDGSFRFYRKEHISEYGYGAVSFYPDMISCLHRFQKFIAQRIDGGHGAFGPYVGEDGARRGEGVDRFGEKHTGGAALHGVGAIKYHPAGGGADRLGEAEGFPRHFPAVEIRVVLIAAGGFFIAELQRFLEGGQRIQSAVRNQGFRFAAPRHDDASVKCFHVY